MIKMNVTYTNDKTSFEKLNVPKLGICSKFEFYYPTNLVFNKVYYKEKEGKLLAFKVLAMAYSQHRYYKDICVDFNGRNNSSHNKVYLVQYPNGDVVWEIETLSGKVFESKQHYFDYISGVNPNAVDFKSIEMWRLVDCRNGLKDDYCSLYVEKTFRWNVHNNKPTAEISYIPYIFFNENGMTICYDVNRTYNGEYKQGFSTLEDCMKHHINGMEVEEFGGTEMQINIKIEVVKPITSTIQVIEY